MKGTKMLKPKHVSLLIVIFFVLVNPLFSKQFYFNGNISYKFSPVENIFVIESSLKIYKNNDI